MKNLLLNLKTNKRVKFIIIAVLITLSLYGRAFLSEGLGAASLIIGAIIVLVGTYYTQEISRKIDTIPVILMPVFLYSAAILSLSYFPNLGNPTKFLALTAVGVIYYIVSLVNNIFIVVESEEKRIPLYRVAVTWSQILLIVISIPFFAGLFKVPVDPISQNLFSFVASMLFSLYLLWALSFDDEIRDYGLKEAFSKSIVVGFIVFCSGVAVSFIPTESFLRAIFVSSVMMSVLGYIQNHYKNAVTTRLIYEYILISFVFLIILLIFIP